MLCSCTHSVASRAIGSGRVLGRGCGSTQPYGYRQLLSDCVPSAPGTCLHRRARGLWALTRHKQYVHGICSATVLAWLTPAIHACLAAVQAEVAACPHCGGCP
jgi:hypothetical protein